MGVFLTCGSRIYALQKRFEMSIPSWKEFLGLQNRVAPELYERGQPIENSPYAEEIRKVMFALDLSAMFCIKGVPQITVLEQDEYKRDEVLEAHAALWNQGLASVLVVMSEDNVRVFSLVKAPGVGNYQDRQQFEKQCLIETIEATATAVSLRGYVYGVESGRLWHEKSEYFNSKERIDSVLLNNLTVAQNLLVHTGLSVEEAQAILIQTMFIAYLEDRGITAPSFFKNLSKGKQKTLSDVLVSGNADLLKRLFGRLRQNFNGDLFVAPCSFDDPRHSRRLSAEAMDILRRFREGQEKMTREGGQMKFWGYNFKFIPVELISAVYDRFLGHETGVRRTSGAYYTPMLLVDTVISSVWETIDDRVKAKGTVLDPACGSGVFLVRIFQRLCEYRRQNAKGKTIRWDVLVKMLQRVHGRDLNGTAVRVAVFSLYIALLEEVTPPDIQKISAKGRLLPSLWNKTLRQGDFFEENAEALQFDLIVGNPPWLSRSSAVSSGITWCASRGLPLPAPGLEEAWAFTWKALAHLANQGTTAFLLPAMGFLHNHAANRAKARVRLFEETRVFRVVNFSDLRRQLFDSAIHATALIIFQRDRLMGTGRDYRFDYWAPKADLNLAMKRFIALSKADKSRISLSNVRKNPLVFKQRLWMRSPEAKLFNYLDTLPKLNSFVGISRSNRGYGDNNTRAWTIGQGFQPYNGPDKRLGVRSPYESKVIANYKHLPINALTPVSIDTGRLEPFSESIVRRTGFENGFFGPRVLVSRGVSSASMRLRAAYVEEPITFQDAIQVIIGPEEERERAKLITAILNSRFAVWYSFHGTASFGSSRPQVNQSELLKLPMPEPEHLPSNKSAQSVRKKLVDLINHCSCERDEVSLSLGKERRLLRKIDSLTYAYFGLSDEEITLIEDSVEHIIPSIQPRTGTFPDLWKTTCHEERAEYANQLITSLSDWFDRERRLSIRLVGSNEDFGILRLRLHGEINTSTHEYTESVNTSFSEALGNISNALNRSIIQNFQIVPDLKIFVGENLFLIKPMQRRFWLKSTALVDADDIVSDLETNIAKEAVRGSAL